MNKYKEHEVLDLDKEAKRLIDIDGIQNIALNFQHLDSLIGSLCHVADLDSDKEHREHVKSEIKLRCRAWLQDLYDVAGYRH